MARELFVIGEDIPEGETILQVETTAYFVKEQAEYKAQGRGVVRYVPEDDLKRVVKDRGCEHHGILEDLGLDGGDD